MTIFRSACTVMLVETKKKESSVLPWTRRHEGGEIDIYAFNIYFNHIHGVPQTCACKYRLARLMVNLCYVIGLPLS